MFNQISELVQSLFFLATIGWNHMEMTPPVLGPRRGRWGGGGGREVVARGSVDNIAITKVITARNALVDTTIRSTSLGFKQWVEHLCSLFPKWNKTVVLLVIDRDKIWASLFSAIRMIRIMDS